MSSSSYDKIRERLVEYRDQKRKERPPLEPKERENVKEDDTPDRAVEKINNQPTEEHQTNSPTSEKTSRPKRSGTNWIVFSLKCLLWCLLQWFFVEIEFGIAFFIASCLYFIYASLVGSRRKPSELSAYSVFNKNFERIEGTLTAEQFEREIRHGPAAVR